jgi:hypothetical protein
MNEFRVALMPPRRRVLFLLGGAVSSSILQGYTETERLLEKVVLDDDDPFFFGEKGLQFSSMIAELSLTNIYPGFSPGNKVHKYYFGVWTLSGLRVWIVFELSSLGRLAMSKEVLGTQT